MIEEEINQKNDPWEDAEFLKELDIRLKAYESGEVEALSWSEVKQKILSKKKGGI